jgi:hypothetical protein
MEQGFKAPESGPRPIQEQEWKPRAQNLTEVPRNSDLHLDLEESGVLEALLAAGINFEGILHLPGQSGYVFVGEYYSPDDLPGRHLKGKSIELHGVPIDGDTFVGYGTGSHNVGFCKFKDISERIKGNAMEDDENFSLFIPIEIQP